MAEFYRKKGEDTIYEGYDPKTGQFSGGISDETKAQSLGVIPDWQASWKPAGATTNIQTITPTPINFTPIGNLPTSLPGNSTVNPIYQNTVQQPTTPTPVIPPQDTVPTTPSTVASQFTEGSLIRAEGTPEVYMVGPDGKAHIPDPETFEKLYGADAWGSIQIISPEQLGAIPTADPLSSQSIGNIEGAIRNNPQTGKKEVFTPEGTWVAAETFTPDTIDQVSTAAVVSGAALDTDTEAAIAEGDLVRAQETPEVFLATGEGLKHITSPAQFEQFGYKWENVRDLTPALIASYKQGGTVTNIIDDFNKSISDQTNQLIQDATNDYDQIVKDITSGSDVETLETEQSGWRKKIVDMLAGLSDKVKSTSQDPTVIAREAELTALEPLIAAKEGAMELAIEKSGGSLESMSFIRGEQAQIRNIYNIELKTMYAKQAALQGNLDRAVTMAQDAIDTALKQEEIKLQTLQQALAFTQADLTREDQKVANAMQFALTQYQAELEQTRQDSQNRANTYAQIIATYGDVPGLDPSMDVTAQWALVGPQATTERNLRMAALQKQISDTGVTAQTGTIPASEALKLGVPYGTTYEEYAQISAPGDWSDNQFHVAFRGMLSSDKTYQEALDELSLDSSITNQDRGRFIAAKMWGQIEPGTLQAVFEGKASPVEDLTANLPAGQSQIKQPPEGLGIFDDYKGITFPDVLNLYK